MTTTSAPPADEAAASSPSPVPNPPTPSATQTAPSSTAVPPSPRLRQISATASANVRRPSSSLSDARDPSASRRQSEQRMLPPPAPLGQPPFAQPPSPGGSIRSVSSISGSETGVGNGPGPTRLPRQLSPAEIHAELEKEQEAAVNRLTRQLSILRAQQQVSPTSHPISDDLSSTYPSSSYLSPRSRRTSSNASTALTNAATIGSTMAGSSLSRQSSIQSLSAARDPTSGSGTTTTRPAPIPMSRQSSVRSISGSRASGRNSPALGDSESPYPYFGSQYYYTSPHLHPGSGSWKDSVGMVHLHNHHQSREREREYAGSETGGSERGLGVSYSSSAGGHPRYEEVLTARNELENVKKENEKLKEKIRELERALAGVGGSSVSVAGSEKVEKEKEGKAEEVKSGEA
ncbi:hypothetical protein ABW19_dt0200178 [Dactylella cylindrospora]|nr:hypothetical protein ABW19_dt0200178 [Dactylella cylindrospora]